MAEYRQHTSEAFGSRTKICLRLPVVAALRSNSAMAKSYDGNEYPQTIQTAAVASSSSALLQTGRNHAGISFSGRGGIIAALPPPRNAGRRSWNNSSPSFAQDQFSEPCNL